MMLFYTKVKKFGMITIMATIVGIYLCVTGMGFWPILFGVVFGFLAEPDRKKRQLRQWKEKHSQLWNLLRSSVW